MTTGQMTALIADAGGSLRIERRAAPVPAPGEALVRIAYGGICGSDLHYWQHGAVGESVLRGPMVLGHEVSGSVVTAADDGGPAAGTRVVIHPATLGSLNSLDPASPRGYLGSAATWPHTDGAFAGLVAVPTGMLRTVPDGVSLRDAALAEPAAVAWHAVAQAGDVQGKRVLVIGCGPIGLLLVAVLRRAGVQDITAVDVQDPALQRAADVGAQHTMDAAALADHAGRFDVVFESSGTVPGLASAIQSARRRARVVMVGLLPPGPQPVAVSAAIARELELVGSFRFVEEISEVLDALADGSLAVGGVVTHEFAIADALAAFEAARDSRISGKVLLRF